MTKRSAIIERRNNETQITLRLELDGEGRSEISTGVGFFDHMLTTLARHSRIDLELRCQGDLHVDDHHTVENCALALGWALDEALGDRRGIARFGWAFAPLDEALARAVIDLSGRACAEVDLGLVQDKLGTLSTENAEHAFRSLATAARATIHVDVLRGKNDHHRAEAAFKALALALRQALALDGTIDVPSTKGVL